MKKIFLILFLLITVMILPTVATAAPDSAPTVNDFFSPSEYVKGKMNDKKIDLVKKLPQGSIEKVLAAMIKLILGITGSLAFISFTWAGIMFITAQGDETHLTKAKKMLFWSILALAIIATSYAITLGVSQLKF